MPCLYANRVEHFVLVWNICSMSTLSDVTPQRGNTMTSCTGPTPDVLPEVSGSVAANSDTGVSIENAPTDNRTWYVLRVTYGREHKAYEHLTASGIRAYLPQHFVYKIREGKRIKQLRPLIPNLLFVHCFKAELEAFFKGPGRRPYIRYCYNHLQKTPEGKDEVMTIRDKDMQNFIRITSVNDPHIKVLAPESTFKAGDYVEVTDGAFTGVTGIVTRLSGEQRVVVKIDNLVTIATAYVPTAFLKRL